MQGNQEVVVGKRYGLKEMVAHNLHMLTCVILIISGLYMMKQFNICAADSWGLISYDPLRLIHIVVAILFLLMNWVLIPYNLISSGHIFQYIFGPKDIVRLKDAFVGIFNKEQYPKYTIYNKTTGHYENALHPVVKLLCIFEGMAIVLIALTGFIMIDLNFVIIHFNIPLWNDLMTWLVEDVIGFFAAFINMTGVQLVRSVHLWATYWFVIELIFHLGFLFIDPRTGKYFKAMFLTGKEEMDEYTEVTEGGHEEKKEKHPIIVFR